MLKKTYLIIAAFLVVILALIWITVQKPVGITLTIKKTGSGQPEKTVQSRKALPAVEPEIKAYTIELLPDRVLPGGISLCPQDRLKLTFRNLTKNPYTVQNQDLPLAFGPIEAGETKTFSYQVPSKTGTFPLEIKSSDEPLPKTKDLKFLIGKALQPQQTPADFRNLPGINCP